MLPLRRNWPRGKVKSLMKAYGDGSRAIVKVNWLLRYRGHVFIAEKQEQTICFLDPQTGNIDVSWYFCYADPATVVVLRMTTFPLLSWSASASMDLIVQIDHNSSYMKISMKTSVGNRAHPVHLSDKGRAALCRPAFSFFCRSTKLF